MKRIEKFQGCLLGGAIGDALGAPIEFNRSVVSIKNKYGEKGITRFELQDGKARITDDTQMTLFTANGLIWRDTRLCMKGIAPPPIAAIYMAYKNWHNTQLKKEYRDNSYNICWISHLKELNVQREPGLTCMTALSSPEMGTIEKPINNSKGCGGLMRVAPCGLYFRSNGLNDYDILNSTGMLAAKASALTHGHPLGIIPSYVFAIIINILAHNDNVTIEEAVNIAMRIYKSEFNITDRKTNENFIKLIEKAQKLAKENYEDADCIYELGDGFVADEALAIAIYSCLKYSNDFEKAIVCAVNHGGDSDSTGSIAGNIMGAYLGISKIPKYYKQNIELKNEIIELASDLFVDCPVNEYYDNNDEMWLKKYLYNDKNFK